MKRTYEQEYSDVAAVHLSERMLAKRWSVSGRTLQRWRNERYGPAWIRIGGSIRYALDDVRAYEAAQRSGGAE